MDTYILRKEVLDSVLNGTIEAVGYTVDILASAHPEEGIGPPLLLVSTCSNIAGGDSCCLLPETSEC